MSSDPLQIRSKSEIERILEYYVTAPKYVDLTLRRVVYTSFDDTGRNVRHKSGSYMKTPPLLYHTRHS